MPTSAHCRRTILLLAFLSLPAFAQTGVYTQDGGTNAQASQTYAATTADQSAIYIINNGVLTLTSPVITKTGNSSDVNRSSQYGLNAGVLAMSGSSVTITGGSVNTNASGSNGLFASGTNSVVSMTSGTIITSATASHGVDVTYGGTVRLTDVNVTTAGDSASAGLSTDFGGGTVIATRGVVTTAGTRSPALYSTGNISVTDGTLIANGGPGGVIDGANAITITNTSLTGKLYGIRAFRSARGTGNATITVDGGSVTVTAGDAFYVTANTGLSTAATITIKNNAKIMASSGNLLNVDTASTGTLTAIGETLSGNLLAAADSTVNAALQSNTTLTGTITHGGLTVDASSRWIVTGNSTLTSLTDNAGISGSSITNINGNGYTVTYDATLAANSALNGSTYTLNGGGILTPAGSVVTSAPAISANGIGSAASGATAIAPGAWISIYGTNLASAATSATSNSLVNGYLPTTLGGTSVTINGKPAYLNYVSPTQLNVQVPADTSTGNVTVIVTTAAGTNSSTVLMQSVLPGFFTANNYVLAVRPSDSVIINGTGAPASGYTTAVAARPGDVLEFFATGLGPVSPAQPAGLVFSGSYPTTTQPTVTIGGISVPVAYSGLIGAGLYQLNITVPTTLVAGTYPVVITMAGVSSPSSAVLMVAP